MTGETDLGDGPGRRTGETGRGDGPGGRTGETDRGDGPGRRTGETDRGDGPFSDILMIGDKEKRSWKFPKIFPRMDMLENPANGFSSYFVYLDYSPP